ncbi:MAG: hypothetical protein A3K19_15285 [Lentisphaerae bacterium RIFOXYB12_FULL_65_16]|nr:MAG: hypothetical protein A3K18_01780 [Lentisphaerae bacterium RIFOXYA12_64_32]OGV88455.1 MAG: hypothetical protein A3K19_15285 [Lentisphaerae bacterium RIFOXYB12_FULL_65_16]
MKWNNQVKSARVLRGYELRVAFSDGYVGTIDLVPLFDLAPGPLVQELRDTATFQGVRVENGTITFPNGYDLCPDVLRYFCETGRVCSQGEVDRALAPQPESALAR